MPLPRLPRKLGDMLSDKEPTESALTQSQKEPKIENATKPKSAKRSKNPAPRKAASSTKTVKSGSCKTRKTSTAAAPTLTVAISTSEQHKAKGYRAKAEGKKLFVLDTYVLMHDLLSLFQFQDHDVYLPLITLEELDGHKTGMSDVSRNARQVSRYLDQLLSHSLGDIKEGIILNCLGHIEASGKLFFQTEA